METRQTDLARLLMGTKVFVIPQFQRHYKWKQAQWLSLFEDVVMQYESDAIQTGNLTANDGHFLGSIVLHPAPGPASTVSRYLVIDGQQRLTTLMVLIAAARDLRAQSDPAWDPKTYENQYLRNPYSSEDPFRLVLGDNDRDDFVATVYGNSPTGQVGAAYRWFSRALESEIGSDPASHKKLETALFLRMLLVEINTSIDDNIHQIFHTINYAGMKLTAIDLIRNHSFMQFSSDVASHVYAEVWRPMEAELETESTFSRYLWAQLVRANPKATQRDLYGPFVQLVEQRSRVAGSTADAVESLLRSLSKEISLFKLIENPWSSPVQVPDPLRGVLQDLATWGSQTYIPLALELLGRATSGKISYQEVTKSLRMVLSYVVRRGLAGIPTNNLNRILSGIPRNLADTSEVAASLEKELSAGSRYWPTDAELMDRGRTSAIALTLQPHQIAYILGKIEEHLSPREHVEPANLQVEHLMPRVLTPEWRRNLARHSISEETAATRLHVIGNLTLSGHNQELARRAFREKAEMLAESNLRLNRQFSTIDEWLPESIDTRSVQLLRLATEVWPRPTASAAESIDSEPLLPKAFDVATILDSIPGDAMAFLETVSDLAALSIDQVELRANQLGYPVISRVMEGKEVKLIGGIAGSFTADLSSDLSLLTSTDIVRAVETVGAQGQDDA